MAPTPRTLLDYLAALLEKEGVASASDKALLSDGTLLTLAKIKTLFGLDNGEATIPVEWGANGATAPDAAEDITSGNSVDRVRKFSNSGSPALKINWKIPNDINAAAPNLKYRVHCIVTESTGMANEAIRFKLSGYSVGHGDGSDGTPGDPVTSAKTGVTAAQYKKITTDWSDAVTITDLAAGEVAKLVFERDNTVAANYGQKIGVIFAIEFQYARG